MIYLDYAATTPCDPEVLDAMLPFFTSRFANASSIDHAMGAEARRAVEEARGYVAELVGAKEEDVIFTSGSTEANNLVLSVDRPIVTSAVEHPSVLEPTISSQRAVRILPVTTEGIVSETALEDALRDVGLGPSIVSIMHTNNETGAQNDVMSIAAHAAEHNALFHTDLTQGVVSAGFSLRKSAVDAVSISAHKIYGPKGVGALICKSSIRKELRPIALGGAHERGFRSGTINVPGVVGFGAAARLVVRSRGKIQNSIAMARTEFLNNIAERFTGAHTVHAGACPNHVVSMRLHAVNNRALLRSLAQKVCFALGSACATNKNEPSHVLRAMGLSEDACNETIRISFGMPTTVLQAREAATAIGECANRLLEMVA